MSETIYDTNDKAIDLLLDNCCVIGCAPNDPCGCCRHVVNALRSSNIHARAASAEVEQLRARLALAERAREELQDKLVDVTEQRDALNRAPSPDYQIACLMADKERLARDILVYERSFDSHVRRAEAAETQLAALRTALKLFLEKHDAVQPAVIGAFQMAAIHGMPYNGPNYADELKALREVAALSAIPTEAE